MSTLGTPIRLHSLNRFNVFTVHSLPSKLGSVKLRSKTRSIGRDVVVGVEEGTSTSVPSSLASILNVLGVSVYHVSALITAQGPQFGCDVVPFTGTVSATTNTLSGPCRTGVTETKFKSKTY